MITPPFTVIVLKKAKKPVTVRVTTPMLLLFAILCIVIIGSSGVAGTYLATRLRIVLPERADSTVLPDSNENVRLTIEEIETAVPADSDMETILGDVELTRNGANNLDITCSFSNTYAIKELYLWLILNPRAEMPAETIIYPLSPLFRGYPVDFRNGVYLDTSQENSINFSLADIATDTRIAEIRLLAYTPDGIKVFDKLFSTRK